MNDFELRKLLTRSIKVSCPEIRDDIFSKLTETTRRFTSLVGGVIFSEKSITICL